MLVGPWVSQNVWSEWVCAYERSSTSTPALKWQHRYGHRAHDATEHLTERALLMCLESDNISPANTMFTTVSPGGQFVFNIGVENLHANNVAWTTVPFSSCTILTRETVLKPCVERKSNCLLPLTSLWLASRVGGCQVCGKIKKHKVSSIDMFLQYT